MSSGYTFTTGDLMMPKFSSFSTVEGILSTLAGMPHHEISLVLLHICRRNVNRGYYSNTDGAIDSRIRSGFVKDIDRKMVDVITKKLLG